MRIPSTLLCIVLLFSFGLLEAQVPDYVPEDGLIGWWPFNGNANDESGNGNHGTESNIEYTNDRYSKNSSALLFDGKSSFVSIKEFGLTPLSDSAITITGWVKTNHIIPENESMIVCSARGNSSTAFVINPDNLIICTFANSQGGFHNFYSDKTNIISDGKWHFFAMVFDGYNQRTYLDSKLIWDQYYPFDLLANGLLEFGMDKPYGRYYNGTMDDIGIWSRALSEEEVKGLFESKQDNSVVPDYVPSTGLVGWWPFNGNANDESGNGNHGIVHGAVLTGDRYGNYGKAFSYDGQNDYIEVNNDTTLCPSHYTLSAWVYPTGFYLNSQDDANYIIGKGNDFNNGHYSLHYNSISKKARASIGIGSSGVFVNSETDMSVNNWYHLISTWDGYYLRIYINGILENTMAYPSNIQGVNNEKLFFGTMATNSTWPYWLNGKIDDIGIWNRALDSNDILKLYQGTSTNCYYSIKESDTTVCPGTTVELNAIQTNSIKSEIPKNGLVGYWPFNGNANDESGKGNNGNVNGAQLTTDRCNNANSAYKLNGIDNFIESARISLDTFTFSLWFNNQSTKQFSPLIDAYDENWEALIYGNRLKFVEWTSKDSVYNLFGSNDSIQLNEWYNFTGSYVNKELRLYLNGKHIYSDSNIILPFRNNGSFYFGKSQSGTEQFFNGKIDDILIWNRKLSDSEVVQVFNASPCGCTDILSNDKFVWSDGQKGRKITVKPDTTTTYVLSVSDGATLHRDSIKVTVGGDSCITCIYGIKQTDTTICQGTALELDAEINTVSISMPKDGLIGWWPFNGNANDESGNGNHGTLFNASCVKDRNNHSNAAYSLNGTDAYISIGNFISPPLADSSISITGWIKTDYDNSDAMNVVGARGNAPTCFAINPDNLITCTFANAGGGFHNFYSDDFIISDGKWHFFAMIYDGKTQRTYLDSMLIWKSDFQFDLLVNGLLEFGRDNPYGRYFNGIIDDIAIWNRAITQDEVRKMYELNMPKPVKSIPTNGLIGYWPFDGNAKDQTSFENHGTVKGATLTTDRCQKRNAAYQFNGIDNVIEVANSESLSNVESITMSAWILLDSMRFQHQGICTKWWQGVNCTNNSDTYTMSINNHPQTNYQTKLVCGTNNYSNYDLQTTNPIPETEWVHLMFVHNSITGGKLYINSVLAGTTGISGSICQSTNPLLIGADNNQGSYWRFFDGKIDDIAIWNRPLSDSEVTQVYNAGSCNCTDTLPENKFTWSTGEKGRKITVTPNASTMYTLEVDRGKKIDRDTIHVTVLESPTPDIFGHVKVYERQINYSYYTPFNDSSTYEWSISGNGRLSSTNGGSSILVDFKEPGYAYLTVTETNKYGCKKDTTITIRIYRMTDIADSENESEELNIYPNPMNEFGSVMVKAFIPPSTRASVSIVDMLGKNLVTSELDVQNAYREIHVPISTESLINSIYMIQLRIDGNIISKKLIINR